MKRTLQLSELAPYLPYGVKIMRPDGKTILTLEGMANGLMIFMEDDQPGNTYGDMLGNKPILRPMSEAIIPYNGIPIDEDGYCEPNDLFIDKNGVVAVDFQAGGQTISWPVKDMHSFLASLFKEHFDVFGLIEAGLAVDINTIQK